MFKHLDITVHDRQQHVVTAGKQPAHAILLLHGYPQSWLAFEDLMKLLSKDYYVLAVDLPGIGDSEDIGHYDKKTLATHLASLIMSLGLSRIVVAGHDIGGMIAYAMLRQFPHLLDAAIIMSTAIPGVEPWEEVKRNPYIWHFAYFATPVLPEAMIPGHESILCNYFYDTLAFNKQAVDEEKRQHYIHVYANANALNTSLGWYRAFATDEKEPAPEPTVDVPVLYLRGDQEPGDLSTYTEGLKNSGCTHVTGIQISNSGHFTPEENPAGVARAIHAFLEDNQPT
nr:alpha/beta hydrolase [uncultured Chitinophaga sp.]